MITCGHHRRTEADFHCPRCEKAFCADCSKRIKLGTADLTVCPQCDNILVDLHPYRPVPPFWTNLGSIMKLPFRGVGWIILFAWPIYGLIIRGAPFAISAGEFTMHDATSRAEIASLLFMHGLFYGFYLLMMAPIFHHAVKPAIFGEFGLDRLNTSDAIDDLIWAPLREVIGPIIAVFWPSAFVFFFFWQAFNDYDPSSGAGGDYLAATIVVWTIIILFGVYIFPIAFLCLVAFRNFVALLSLPNLVRISLRINKEYLIFTGVVYGYLAVYALLVFAWIKYIDIKSISHLIAFLLIDSFIHGFLILFFAQLLGYMAYQTRYKLKWWPDTRNQLPDLAIDNKLYHFDLADGQTKLVAGANATTGAGLVTSGAWAGVSGPEAAPSGPAPSAEAQQGWEEKIQEARYLHGYGNYTRAEALFAEVLSEAPRHYHALTGMLAAAFKLDDHDAVRRWGKVYGSELVRQHAEPALWDAYRNYREVIPDFVFDPPELLRLADWLEKSGEIVEAARVLRELARAYPDHPAAPAALLHCARVLLAIPEKNSAARSVLAAILERYPNSEAAAQAAQLLGPDLARPPLE